MHKRIFRCALAALIACLCATTALASASAKKHTAVRACTPDSCTAPAPNADPNAVLRLASIGAPGEWDPHNGRSPAQDQIFMSPLYDELLQLDGQGVPKPELATSYKMASNQMSMSLTLRRGVTFHDGTPFNAAAVIANENYAQSTGGLGAENLKANDVTSVVATGPYSVVFHFSAPNPTFPINLAYNESMGAMVSPTVLAHDPKSLATTPAGSGPYVLASETVTTVTYKKASSYWNRAQWKQLPKEVEFEQIADDDTRLAAFETGQLDGSYVYDPIPGINQVVRNSGGHIKKFESRQALGDVNIQLNYKDAALQNAKVRAAMSYALDRAAICAKVYLGLCTPAIQPFEKGTPGYDPAYPYKPSDYSVAKARQLLKQSGIPSSGLSLTMFAPQDPIDEQLDPLVQSELDAAGFNITLVPVAQPLAPTDWGEGQVDMWLSVISGNPNINATLQNDYVVPPNMPGGTAPALVPIFNRANAQLVGTKARTADLEKVSAFVASNYVDIIIGHDPAVYLVKSYVGGMSTMVTAEIGIAYQVRYLYVMKH